MSEHYSKVEIVTPKWTSDKWVTKIFGALFGIALKTLVVWWFFAAWLPELGLTYWQLVLPVYAIVVLFPASGIRARILK